MNETSVEQSTEKLASKGVVAAASGSDAGELYDIMWTIRGTPFEAHGGRRRSEVAKAVADALEHGATDIIINRVDSHQNIQ